MTTLKSLVDETTNIKDSIVNCYNYLLNVFTEKNIYTNDFNGLTDLINEVKYFENYKPNVLYLYKDGERNFPFTTSFGKRASADYMPSPCTITKLSNCVFMDIGATDTYATGGTKLISPLLDYVGYNKQIVEFKCTNLSRTYISFYNKVVKVADTTQGGVFASNTTLAESKIKLSSTGSFELQLDISNVNASYYSCFELSFPRDSYGGKATIEIKSIRLEK